MSVTSQRNMNRRPLINMTDGSTSILVINFLYFTFIPTYSLVLKQTINFKIYQSTIGLSYQCPCELVDEQKLEHPSGFL